MLKSLLLLVITGVGLAALPAQATCTYPRAPERLPDGATATLEQMVAGQKAVKQFDADITAYTDCLQQEYAAATADPALDPEKAKELDAMRGKKHNAAVDDAEAVATRFNEQVRAFKARTKKE